MSTLSYDVEIARHEHLANYTFHDATGHDPPGLASFTLACPPCRPSMHPRQFNLASSGAPLLDSPCGPQRSVQVEVLPISSTTQRKLVDTIRLHAVNARGSFAPSGHSTVVLPEIWFCNPVPVTPIIRQDLVVILSSVSLLGTLTRVGYSHTAGSEQRMCSMWVYRLADIIASLIFFLLGLLQCLQHRVGPDHSGSK